MTLQSSQKLGFKGTVQVVNVAKLTGSEHTIASVGADNPLLRPLIRQLKHHCGSKDVHHTINIGELQIGVTSSYRPKKSVDDLDEFVRKKDIISSTNAPLNNEEHITDLINWSKGTKEWMQYIKSRKMANLKQEKEAVQLTSKPPSRLKRFLSRFF